MQTAARSPRTGAGIDVIVAGGGNAALCAAIAARRGGASVLLLERAPENFRGGNTRHTRNIRLAHDGPTLACTGTYGEAELFDDLLRVTGGETDRPLAELIIRESLTLADWMSEAGIHWQGALKGTLHLNRTNSFFLGGGKQLLNTYYDTAVRLGVQIRYETTVRGIVSEGRTVHGVSIECGGVESRISCGTLIVAAGGFEADIAWLKEYWGASADNFLIRGTPFNTGLALKAMYEAGARHNGDPKGLHCVACDARSPKFDGGIVTRVDAVPFGIVVNENAERFYDEGEELWPKRYAIWGKLIAEQPNQRAFVLGDAKAAGRHIPSVFRPMRADTIAGLALALGLDPAALERTAGAYNAAIVPGGTFAPESLDDCRTDGLVPPKSHWAQALDRPPYYGYPVRPGVTFTYLGVAVDERAHVIDEAGNTFENLLAAGECMSGNILTRGYLAGFGLTIGTAYGRIAGIEAARLARV